MHSQPAARRVNLAMAEQDQCGIALMHVAGVNPAQRYLVRCGVPQHVIERVLLNPPYKRRIYGSHDVSDVGRHSGEDGQTGH